MKGLFTFALLLITQFIFSQNAIIKGTVLDDATAAPLPGVNIIIKELKLSTTSDSEGKFIFRSVKPGVYEVEFSFIGLKPKLISEVIATSNETTELNSTLEEVKNTLEEVVITKTKAKAESVKSLLTMQKNNASVSDGISAETIKKTPDRTTSDVLKRISGASVQDNKFVIIRGLNDRYNVALLNGAPLPSSEPDRKAFSFDIFPSNILDNLIITKTATPDLPGEFAGGVVQINTKSVPDKNFQSVTVGTGYNTVTTFKEQKYYEGSSTDWIGYDNGVRDIPSSVPTTEVFNTLSDPERASLAQSFEYDWSIKDKKFAPNTNFQYSIGRHIKLKNEKSFGLIFSLSNNKTNNFNIITRKDYQEIPNQISDVEEDYIDKNYTEQVLTAGLANFSFKFNDNHSISFKNIYSINSTDLVVERTGKENDEDTRVIKADVRWFTSNNIYSGQFNGENNFPSPKIKINWGAFYSDIQRSIPNLRRNVYSIGDPDSTDPNQTIPVASIGVASGGPDFGGGMFFSENSENIKGGRIDIAKKFNLGKDFINELKIGGLIQVRERDFFARQLQYVQTGGTSFQTSLLNLPNETIFTIPNMGVLSPGVNGFSLQDFSKFTDAYTAASDLKAAYIMLDNRFGKFRLVWGVRFEDFLQTLDARLTETEYLPLYRKGNDLLPSVNLIFSINKKQNLRLSYSETLNRPEYRELAPFGFYDFTTQFFTQGNPDLKFGKIKNMDIRYELYPGKGQILSLSYFRKNFTDPIELQQQINNNTVRYENAKSAVNSGIEFELRTLLSSIINKNAPLFFEDITLYTNFAIIKSEVDLSNLNSANIDTVRPLQGQSPYIFNGGLQYFNADNGWSFSSNINRAGNRILFTEAEGKPAIWEKGRTFLDMQVSKTLYKKKLEIKLNIQNILAQDLIFYQNNYRNTEAYGTVETFANYVFTGDYHNEDGYSEQDDDVRWRTKFGRSFSLSFTYNF